MHVACFVATAAEGAGATRHRLCTCRSRALAQGLAGLLVQQQCVLMLIQQNGENKRTSESDSRGQ